MSNWWIGTYAKFGVKLVLMKRMYRLGYLRNILVFCFQCPVVYFIDQQTLTVFLLFTDSSQLEIFLESLIDGDIIMVVTHDDASKK